MAAISTQFNRIRRHPLNIWCAVSRKRDFLFIMALVIIIVPVYSVCGDSTKIRASPPANFPKRIFIRYRLGLGRQDSSKWPAQGQGNIFDAIMERSNGCAYPQSDPLFLEKEYNLGITAAVQGTWETGMTLYWHGRMILDFIICNAAMVHVYCGDYWIRSGIQIYRWVSRMREEMRRRFRLYRSDWKHSMGRWSAVVFPRMIHYWSEYGWMIFFSIYS